MSSRRSSSIPRAALIGAGGVVVAIAAALVIRGRTGSESAMSAASAETGQASLEALLAGSASAGTPSSDSSQPRAQILGKTSLADAIAVARPLMTNTAGRLDQGSAVLAIWAADKLTWDALDHLAETSPARFRKDPEAERGKRFCITGTIQEIRAEKTLAGRLQDDRAMPLIERGTALTPTPTPIPTTDTLGVAPGDSASSGVPLPLPGNDLFTMSGDWTIPNGGKVFVAVLKEKVEPPAEGAPREARRLPPKDPLVAEIIAVRSTGALVDGSEARVCGVLTGVTLPPVGGSSITTDVTEHRVVGMFDLPENHAAPPELAHHD